MRVRGRRDEPGEQERIELFGDEIESVRTFDPADQRTTGRIDRFVLLPASEALLDEVGITMAVEEEDEVAAVVAEVFAAVGFAEFEGGAAAGAEPPLSPGS